MQSIAGTECDWCAIWQTSKHFWEKPRTPKLKFPSPIKPAIQARGSNSSNDIPYATNAITKVMTIYPITRRIPMPAIARMGRAKNGWSMFATDSPIATAMVVPAKQA